MGYDFYVPVGPKMKEIDAETRALIDQAIADGKMKECLPCKYSHEVGAPDAGTKRAKMHRKAPVIRDLPPEYEGIIQEVIAKHGMGRTCLLPSQFSNHKTITMTRECFARLWDAGLTYLEIAHCFDRTAQNVASMINHHKKREAQNGNN